MFQDDFFMYLSIFCPREGAAGIHGAFDRTQFPTGRSLTDKNGFEPGKKDLVSGHLICKASPTVGILINCDCFGRDLDYKKGKISKSHGACRPLPWAKH